MKIKLPKFAMNMAGKYLSKSLSEELGFNTNVRLNAINLDTKGESYRIHLDTDIAIDKRGVKTYIKSNLKKKKGS